MARIPTLDLPTVNASDGVAGRVAAPNFDVGAGDQAKQMGAALSSAGQQIGQIAADRLQQANQIRVNDAVNQAREAANKLTFDPNTGYTALKGVNALERPDGKTLSTEYGDQLRQQMSEIGASLGNDAQRRAFQVAAGQLQVGFDGDVERHVAGEFKTYHSSVADGTVALNSDDMVRYYNDPEKTAKLSDGIKAAIYSKGQLLGLSASEIDAAQRDALSKAHGGAVAALLQNNDFNAAQTYLEAHKSDINANDLLRLQAGVTKQQVSTYATNLASKTFYGAGGADAASPSATMFPDDLGRLTNLAHGLAGAVAHVESGNRETNPDGTRVTSSAGAKGVMQVMDGTARDPGLGVKPSNGTPEDDARVGRDYLGALVTKYHGDTVHALWAYNWGMGNVDAYLKTGKGAKGQPMPQETADYANKVYAAYKGGGGQPNAAQHQVTLSSLYQQIQSDPFLQAHPEGMEVAMQQARTLYAAMKEDRDTARNDATANVERALLGNGGQMSPSMWSAVPNEDLGHVMAFSKEVEAAARNPVKQSDPIVYGSLLQRAINGDITDPNSSEMLRASLKLTDNDFQKLQETVARTNSKDQKQIDTNNTAQRVLSMITPDIQAAGLNPHPKESDSDSDKQKIAAFTGTLYDQLDRATQAKGKPLTTAEARKVGLDLLSTVPGSAPHFWSSDKRAYELADVGAQDGRRLMTPSVRNQIAARLTANRIPVTEANIRRAFNAMQVE